MALATQKYNVVPMQMLSSCDLSVFCQFIKDKEYKGTGADSLDLVHSLTTGHFDGGTVYVGTLLRCKEGDHLRDFCGAQKIKGMLSICSIWREDGCKWCTYLRDRRTVSGHTGQS